MEVFFTWILALRRLITDARTDTILVAPTIDRLTTSTSLVVTHLMSRTWRRWAGVHAVTIVTDATAVAVEVLTTDTRLFTQAGVR